MAEVTLTGSGGWNQAADSMTCPTDQYLGLSSNAYYDSGKLKFRSSSAKLKSTAIEAAKIDLVTGWQDPAQIQTAANYIVVALTNNKVYTAPWIADALITGASSFMTFTDRTNAVSVGKFPATCDTLNGNLVICTNNQPPVTLTTYNGNIAVLGGTPPTGVCVKTVNNFMFIAGTMFVGTAGLLSRVRWSNVNDPTTWTAGNYVDFRLNDGDFVMALGSLAQDLIIFKTNSIGRLFTTTQTVSGAVTLGPLVTLFTGIGCCSPMAVDNLPDGRLVFLGSDFRLYVTDGSSLQCLSERPYPGSSVFPGSQLSGSVGITNFPIVKVSPSTNEVWVVSTATTAGGTSSGFPTVYDYKQNVWSYTNTQIGEIECLGLVGPQRTSATVRTNYRLIHGDAQTIGNVYITGGLTTSAALAVSGGAIIFSLTLTKDLANFLPTFVVINCYIVTTGTAVGVFSFDDTNPGGTTFALKTYSASYISYKQVFPIPYPKLAGSKPASIRLTLSGLGASDTIYSVTFTDEAQL